MKKILSFCAALFMTFAASAAVINIDSSTADALRHALNDAATGDEIVMAAGTYVESPSNYIAFAGKNVTVKAAAGAEVVLKPHVPITISGGATATIKGIKIDASELCSVNTYEHLIYASDADAANSLVLEGCEVYGFGINSSAIHCSADTKLASVTVNKCYFHNIRKSGMFFENPDMASLTVTNSTFANYTVEDGDASSYYAGCIFTKAELTAVNVVVDHCTFYNINCMNTDYGAVKVKADVAAAVSNCVFMMPESYSGGRAVYNTAGTVDNCITYNYGKDSGTGLHSGPTITACSVADPLFVNAAAGDFTLGEGSPALTAAADGGAIGDPRWGPAVALDAPEEAAAAPAWPANQVKAVYAPAYNADCEFGEWGSGTAYTQDTYGKKYVTTGLGYFGLVFNGLNCMNMQYLHFDIWIASDASMRFVPIWGGAEQGVTKNVTGQQWNSIDIPLTEYDGVTDWSNVYQIKIDNAANLTFWLGNAYFYTTVAPPADETAPADFTAVFDGASFFSVKIMANAFDASGAVTFTVKNGEEVVGSANAASGVDAYINVNGLTPGTDYSFSVIASDESGNAADAVVVAATTLTAPAAAMTPGTDPAEVLSLYSDKYAFAPASLNSYNEGWWDAPVMSEGYLSAGNKALYYHPAATGMIGWQFAPVNATDYKYFHIAVYPFASDSIVIGPTYGGEGLATAVYSEKFAVKANQWNYLTFDLSEKDLSSMFQFQMTAYHALNGFFVDNVFFSKSADITGPQPNVFAYGLKAVPADDNHVRFFYSLNANAVSGEIELLAEDGTVAKAYPAPTADFLTQGDHNVDIDLSEFPAGTYNWAVKVTGEANNAEAPVKIGTFGAAQTMGRSVAIDKNTESPFYGNVYTVNGNGVGLFAWNAALNPLFGGTAVATNGWGAGAASPCRASVAEDGKVYICDWSDSNPNVRIFNPATPAEDAVTVFGGTPVGSDGIIVNENGDTIHGSISYVMPFGSGDDTYIITADEDYMIGGMRTLFKYNIGNAAAPYTAKPEVALAVGKLTEGAVANGNVTFVPSVAGGWWISQHRWSDATANPSILHLAADNTVNFKSNAMFANAEIGYNNQASMDFNSDQTTLVTSTSNTIFNVLVWDVVWTDGVPAPALKYTIPSGFSNTCLKVALDEAGNVYASAAGSPLTVWALPKADNTCTTPAPKAQAVVIDLGDNLSNIATEVKVEKFFRNGQIYIVRDGVVYTITGVRVK